MLRCKNWPVGVCSWSLQQDITGVAKSMKKLGIDHVNLAVLPAVEDPQSDFLDFAKKQDWTISSTMINFPTEDYSTLESIKVTGGIAPDEYWEYNRKLILGTIDITAELNTEYLLMHVGFIDHSQPENISKFYDRVRFIADALETKSLKLLMETGQESAQDLKHFLEKLDHPAVCVNFDPANMILYDKGDPIEAVRILAPWVRHIHIKDAVRTKKPGTWGTEVPWGQGEVNSDAFL